MSVKVSSSLCYHPIRARAARGGAEEKGADSMPVFREKKDKNFTVVHNFYLRDERLSLKAKGLLSLILSLPEGWDYSAYGLASLCRECRDTVRGILDELEQNGYLERVPMRNGNRFAGYRYNIYERPRETEAEAETAPGEEQDAAPHRAEKFTQPKTSAPTVSAAEIPAAEKPAQLNTDIPITEKINTDASSIDSFLPSVPAAVAKTGEGQTEGTAARARIRDQIEYPLIVNPGNRGQLDELVELMTEVSLHQGKTLRLGRDEVYPAGYVRERFGMLTSEHLQKVLDGMRENTTRVYNTRAYLLSALFNATSTLDSHYTMLVNHDLRG